MSIFKKSPNARPLFQFPKLSIASVVIVAILILVLIQAFGILFNLSGIKLGPVFQIMLIAATVILAFALAKKQIQGTQISKADIGALILFVVLTILAMIYMKQFIPDIFREGINQLQSMIPMR